MKKYKFEIAIFVVIINLTIAGVFINNLLGPVTRAIIKDSFLAVLYVAVTYWAVLVILKRINK